MITRKYYFIKFLACLSFIVSLFTYFISSFGLVIGIRLALLTWSLYVLSIPAGHGQFIFGYPLRIICSKKIYTELYLWISSLVLNGVMYLFLKQTYSLTIPTYFLCRCISKPNPYLIVLVISAFGTLFTFITKTDFFSGLPPRIAWIRKFLIIIGIGTFFYFSHQDLIILCNVLL